MPNNQTIELLIAEADEALSHYKHRYKKLTWRKKVLTLVDLADSVKQLGINSNKKASNVCARERIRLYLTKHVETVISAEELAVVSGISEYGRRIRELRVQDGYKILTGHSNDPEIGINLGPADYFLLDPKPDLTAARRWHIANRIRREKKGGSKLRILHYLLENVGEIVNSEELRYVAKASEFGRRTRQLRTEDGYAIATQFTGRPDLKMGEYILESVERIVDPHDRNIPFDIQKLVFQRADNSCQLCGWNRLRWSKKDPRILELHHLREHVKGGKNDASNLIVLCSKCHDQVHAGKRKLPKNILG